MGDITDAKDHHSARLVNRVIWALHTLARFAERVIVLKGNHDYLQKEHPFFEFASLLDRVTYVSSPTVIEDWMFIPHSRVLPLPGLDQVTRSHTHCFMHQTFMGARTSNGDMLQEGLSVRDLKHTATCRYLSGDIHVPQVIGGVVEYIGAPYPITFGDTFKGRMVVLPSATAAPESVLWEGIKKHTVSVSAASGLDASKVRKGDQVKVRVDLPAARLSEWHAVMRDVSSWCDHHGVYLATVELAPTKAPRVQAEGHATSGGSASPRDLFLQYCAAQRVEDVFTDVGLDLLERRYAD